VVGNLGYRLLVNDAINSFLLIFAVVVVGCIRRRLVKRVVTVSDNGGWNDVNEATVGNAIMERRDDTSITSSANNNMSLPCGSNELPSHLYS